MPPADGSTGPGGGPACAVTGGRQAAGDGPAWAPEPEELRGRLRAASAVIAAWLAAPSEAAWNALRRELAAMEAALPRSARWRAGAALAPEAETYRDQLTQLRNRLLAWQQELCGRRAQLQQSRSDLEGVRGWRDALRSTAP